MIRGIGIEDLQFYTEIAIILLNGIMAFVLLIMADMYDVRNPSWRILQWIDAGNILLIPVFVLALPVMLLGFICTLICIIIGDDD